ncbi:MAG: phosphocholine cytidylyltransferase family protein [Candidatus Latescibacterota bacterium]
MQAVILAAGMGMRLRPLTRRVPKGLLEVGGKALLTRSLESLGASGLERAVIVVGYMGETIRRHLGERLAGVSLRYVDNPRFEATGSMYSLSLARSLLDGPILLLESDLLYEQRAVETMIARTGEDAILIAELLGAGDDVYVCTDQAGRVIALGKELAEEDKTRAAGCLVGISTFSPLFLEEVMAQAEREYAAGLLNRHYEECVLAASLQGRPVKAVHCPDLRWTEIDTLADLERARTEVYPAIVAAEGRP